MNTDIVTLRSEMRGITIVGDKLAEFVASQIICTCRREWVCHKCQTLDAWNAIRVEQYGDHDE